jgi:hypothetical protein
MYRDTFAVYCDAFAMYCDAFLASATPSQCPPGIMG